MNDTSSSSIEELQHQVGSLRTFFLATLAILVLLSFTLNFFVYSQLGIASKQLEENQKFVDDYNKISLPIITDFLTKLTAVGKTNAEIGRLLAKYNIQPTSPNSGTPSPSRSPPPALAPATTPKK